MSQLTFSCSIHKSFNERNKKRYIELQLNDNDVEKILKLHTSTSSLLKNRKIKNPLDGNTLEIKVPFRYNRVSCVVNGSKTVQELVKGDKVQVKVEFCGPWNIGEWSGFAWKLLEINQ